MTSAEKNAIRETKYDILTTGEPFAETHYGIVKRIQVIEKWVRMAKDRMGKSRLSILDYGCGTGDHITAPLARAVDEVLGVDVHEPSILEARRRYALPNLTFRTADAQGLLNDGLSFDVIVCSEVLEHLHDPSGVLGSFRRLLRPGGALIITTQNGYGSFELLCRLERILSRIGVHHGLRWLYEKGRQLSRRAQGYPVASHPWERRSGDIGLGFLNKDSVHVQFFWLRTLERLFSDSGFRVVARRARILLCGPYVDLALRLWPWQEALFRLNNRLADLLPFSWAADWMFLLEPKGTVNP